MKTDYTKPILSTKEHIKLLKSRNLIINNYKFAENTLNNVNYYNLSGYLYVFEDKSNSNLRTHNFTDVNFEEVFEFFKIDTKIRHLLLSCIFYIEVYMKNIISKTFTEIYKDAFYNYNIPNNIYKKINMEMEILANNSKELFILHYKEKYNDFPKLPIWMSVEIMSLGILSKFYLFSEKRYKEEVAQKMRLNHYKYLEKLLHSITIIRNKCAHHSRLLCISLNKLKFPKQNKEKLNCNYNIRLLKQDTLFNFIVNLEYFINKVPICLKNTMPLLKEIYKELYKLNQLNSVKNKSYISNEIGLIDGWNGKEFFNGN